MDQPHHDYLGRRRRADRLGDNANPVLLGAVSAGADGGGLFSRRGCLPYTLVHAARPRAGLVVVSHRLVHRPDHQPEDFQLFFMLGSMAHPGPLGLAGWQWLYIAWGVPAVAIGFVVLAQLPDYPRQAKWLSEDEKLALEGAIEGEKALNDARRPVSLFAALRHPKVLLLTLAYFCIMTGNYGVDIFMPSILERWYSLKLDATTWLIMIPSTITLAAILLIAWNSDRTHERRLHAAAPGIIGGVALALTPHTQGHLLLTMLCFIVVAAGIKSYMAPFWSLPDLFLTDAAAAGSIGLINSIGNLGGFLGPKLVGRIETVTGSFVNGIYCLSLFMILYGVIVLLLGLGRKPA